MPQTLPDQIRSQLQSRRKPYCDRYQFSDGKLIAESETEPIIIQHACGTVTLTPEQARQVLAGRELVSDAMGVRVK